MEENYGTSVPEVITDGMIDDYYNYLLTEPGSNTVTESQAELIVNTLLKENVLTISEIKTCREAINDISDVNKQRNYYVQLQYKVPYYNQRDNTSIQDEPGSVIPIGHRAADVMCNLTSEAGALSTLGIVNPNPQRQYEDNLENIKREQKSSRQTPKARAYIAEKLGATMEHHAFKQPTKDSYKNKLLPLLERGYGVITSFGAHIVRIVGVTEDGLIVNDPYGKLVDFEKRATTRSDTYLSPDKNSKTSSNTSDGGQKGNQNLWSWSVLEKYPLAYYELYYKK